MKLRPPAVALVAVALAAAFPPAAGADVRLSTERSVTRWAHANLLSKVRDRPSRRGHEIARLRWRTEDGPPEVYVVLYSRRVRGHDWMRIRIPGRPNGRTGWVPREALGGLHTVHTALTISQRTLRATLTRRGRVIWSSHVGMGAPGTPTPKGRFWIRERLHGLGGSYGPWAFGTSAYSDQLTGWPGGGVIGIHGTDQPGLIPGRPSHGCVRVPNRAIARLARLMPIGTPVRIR
jgi:lipoprotein-anchoring transpeptidase ErfK/SrfK